MESIQEKMDLNATVNMLRMKILAEAKAITEQKVPDLPHRELAQLNEKLMSSRWLEMVLPGQELETLLDADWCLYERVRDTQTQALFHTHEIRGNSLCGQIQRPG